jgi:hypothetical protein
MYFLTSDRRRIQPDEAAEVHKRMLARNYRRRASSSNRMVIGEFGSANGAIAVK